MIRYRALFVGMLAVVGLTATCASAWNEGNHAGDWTKGATIKVFVDPIPAGAPAGTAGAVTEAIKEWNDAQAGFGGLTLMTAGAAKTNSEIHISWGTNFRGFAATLPTKGPDPGFTKTTVKIFVSVDKGLDARGITRVLKHELGHAEGLGHSAKSDLMKADAYSSNPGRPPSVADLNSAAPFTPPTLDDRLGKNFLWGTAEGRSQAVALSNVTLDGTNFIYDYNVHALSLPSLTDPVTEFTIDMLPDIDPGDFTITAIPVGWHADFFDGDVDPTPPGLDSEAPSPSLLSFLTDALSFGIRPGQTFSFEITSPFGPQDTRAFTGSPSFDSDVFVTSAPAAPVAESSTLFLFATGVAGLGALSWRRTAPR